MRVRVRVAHVRGNPAWLKPADEVTDRALRYRAWHEDVVPPGQMQCGFCGSGRNVVPHHIQGDETDTTAENLMWACKSCNGRVGALLRRNGIGRVTKQYNPAMKKGSRKELLAEYGAAIKVMRGQFDGDVAKAVRTIRSTPRDIRSAYTSRTWPVRRQVYGPSGRAQGQLFDTVPF